MTISRHLLADAIALLQISAVVGFLAYLWGLRALSGHHRPRVPARNRFGEPLRDSENPNPRK